MTDKELNELLDLPDMPDCYVEFCPDCHDSGVTRGGTDCPCYTPQNCPCDKCKEARNDKRRKS